MAEKYDSLSHTKYYTRYHIIFTPKYKRKIIYNSLRKDIGEYLSKLCKYKGVKLIEGHLMPDHVHMLVSIPLKLSVSQFMGYLKGKSAMMIFEYHANLKYKFGNRHFWADGYYVSLYRCRYKSTYADRLFIPTNLFKHLILWRFYI